MLDLTRMRELHRGLTVTIGEFEHAGDTNNQLEEAIGNPDGRDELRDKASDFEKKWNDKRGKLLDNLKGVDDSLRQLIEIWTTWDEDTAAYYEENGKPTTLHEEI